MKVSRRKNAYQIALIPMLVFLISWLVWTQHKILFTTKTEASSPDHQQIVPESHRGLSLIPPSAESDRITSDYNLTNTFGLNRWTSNGPELVDILSVAIAQSNPTTIYAGDLVSGVYKSTNDGASWNLVSTGLPAVSGGIDALAVDPGNPNIVYAGTGPFNNGVYKSTNGGLSWSPSNSGLPASALDIEALAVDPNNPSIIYVATSVYGVFKSTNAGANWTQTGVFPGPITSSALAIDPGNTNIIYAGTQALGAFKSTNGGTTWTQIGLTDLLRVEALAIDTKNTSIIYAAAFDKGVYKSINGGTSWNPINTGLPSLPIGLVFAVAVDPSNPTTVYAATGNGVYKSTNGGSTWNEFNVGLVDSFGLIGIPQSLAIAPSGISLHTGTGSGVYDYQYSGGSCSITCSATVPLTGAAGSSIQFVATATASGCSGVPVYDWDFGDGSPHSTQQNPTYTYTAAGSYSWKLTANVSGASACIKTGTIIINAGCTPPAIVTQPVSQSIISGQSATLTVVVSGATPLNYQWYKGMSGDTSTPISGATASSYTTPPLTLNATYWVRIGNACGSANGNTAAVTVGYCLTTSVSPQGAGIVTANPVGPCYSGPTSVTLTVAPATGYTFDQWSGDASGSANPLALVVNTKKNVIAVFKASSASLYGKIEIWDGRESWKLNGSKAKVQIKISGRFTNHEEMITTSEGSYRFSGLPLDTYDLDVALEYMDEVTVNNYLPFTPAGSLGCVDNSLPKITRLKKMDVQVQGDKEQNISFPPPIVMVHGVASCYEKWYKDKNPDSNASSYWDDHVRSKGWISITPNYNWYKPLSWSERAKKVKEQIETNLQGLSQDISQRQRYPRWFYVAHSMGGLVGRVLSQQESDSALVRSLEKFYLLGTPNSGGYGIALLDYVPFLSGRQAPDLTESYVKTYFNNTYTTFKNKNVEVFAGDAETYHGAKADGVVTVDSALNIYRRVENLFSFFIGSAESRTPVPGATFSFKHTELGSKLSLNTLLVDKILPDISRIAGYSPTFASNSRNVSIQMRVEGTASAASPGQQGQISLPSLANKMNKIFGDGEALSPGQVATRNFTVGATDLITVNVFTVEGAATFSLVDPAGVRLDFSTPPSSGERFSDEFGETLLLRNPAPGQWAVRTTAGPTGASFVVLAAENSPAIFEVAVKETIISSGQSTILLGRFSINAGSVQPTTVTARIYNETGNPVADVTLHDDGGHQDNAAGDGIFAGESPKLSGQGRYAAVFTAQGTFNGRPFSRQAESFVDILPSARLLASRFSDVARDTNGDGKNDVIRETVEITAPAAGSYLVSADLYDSQGYFVDHAVGETEVNSPGGAVVNLDFKVTGANCQQFAGAFSIKNMILRDGGLKALDVWRESLATQTYNAAIFSCANGAPVPRALSFQPNTLPPGSTRQVFVSGNSFTNGTTVSLGNGVAVPSVTYLTTELLAIEVRVSTSAIAGVRDAIITNPDGRSGVSPGLFSVVADQPPAIAISYPADHQVINSIITASATATDDVGIQKVEFYLDGLLAATVTTFPYQFLWNTTTTTDGAHVLTAKTYDTAGQSSTKQITVNVRNTAASVTTVSAASFSGAQLATESIVAAFGTNLAASVQVASSIPLPTSLAGTTAKVKDSVGTERLAPLFFVAPSQVNYQIPPGTASGAATITITGGNGAVSLGIVQIATVAPGLFSANASGQGVATGLALRLKADGSQTYEPISKFDQTQNKVVAIPIDLGPATDQVFLILYGTGIRLRSNLSAVSAKIGGLDAQVLYAGPVDGFVGLDQINLSVPRSLVGRGEVDVVITADGKTANTVQISVGPVTALTPTLASISPNSATAGGSAFTLTVNGTNFVSGSVVRWNGGDKPTTFVSSTQLKAAISAGDIASAGTASITVFNPNGGGVSNSLPFSITQACAYSISPASQAFSAQSGSGIVNVTVASGCNWTASSNVSWITINSGNSGSGNGTITFSVAANSSITQRTGTLTIAFQTFTVTQAAGNPLPTIASLTPNSVIASSQAFSLTVNGTGFIPGSIVRWNGNNRTTTFIGNTQLRADIAASDIAVAGTVAITVFTPAPGGGLSNALSLTITPANQGGGPFTGGTFFDRDGGVIGTAFLFNPVTPSGTLPYVDVHGPAGWNSNNLLRLSRFQFPGMAAERSMGWIFTQPITGNYSALGSVGGQSYESSTSINAADTLSAPQITNLTATPGQVIFTWTASSAAQSFLVRINPLPFAGTITSEVIVSGNSRTATLSGLSLVSGATYQALVFALSLDVKTPGAIAGQFNISTHSISFTAPPACSYSISPTNQSFSASGGSSSVSVTTTSACGWTASSNASWITLTSGFSGNGNGTVFYSVSSNTSTSQRTGTLTIAGQTYTVTQAGAGGITIMDHRMTGGPIPTQCVAPVAKYNFTPTDAQAYQWTLVSGANIGDVMRWEFVQPNGTIYFQTATSPLTFSGNVCFSASIFIAGSAAASLPGNWQVRVIYNNTLILTENFTIGTTINVTWRRSPVWVGDQSGPRDAAGRAWNNPSFDDSQWAIVVLPDSAPSDSPVPNDRYYRAHFNWDVSSPVRANFSADDGLAIYVNGVLLGSWGGYRQFGCVNGPPVCTINTIVSPQTIPASLLRAGDNVIAVDLWNAGLGFSLNVTLDR